MCQLDFRGQIFTSPISSAFSRRYFSLRNMRRSISQVKSPQVLSHLLLVVAIFPLPHPCAIGFLKSNRQIPTSSISSSFSGRYSIFLILHHFPVVFCVVSLRCVSPGRQLQLLTVQTVLSSEAVGASSSKRLPGETQRVQ